MADGLRMALDELLRKVEVEDDVDFLRDGVRVLSQALMELEVSQQLHAERHERTPERTGQRNGYRERRWDTRVGTIDLAVPRVRDGGFIPRLLEPRKRAERALVSVVQERPTSTESRPGGWTSWSRRSGWMASARATSAGSAPSSLRKSSASAAAR